MALPQGHYASPSLYVGDLHTDVTEAMLYEVFNSVGPVASIRVCRDSSTRRSLGYAYVNYHSVGDAERALDTLNYTPIKSIPCRIMWSHRDPSLRKSGSGNIFVKNLAKDIDNKALYDTFSLFGNILSCKVAQDETGKSKGYGFVHYETEDAAQTAIERVNGMMIGTKTVYVGPFKRRSERVSQTETKYTNVYVKNIPSSWDESKVQELFSEYGEVSSVALQTDARGRVFCFVNFIDVDAAKAAVQGLHGKAVAPPSAKDGTDDDADTDATGDKPKDDTASDDKNELDGEKPRKDSSDAEDDPSKLYVSRFQPRAERIALLKSKFFQSAEQRQKKVGVNLYIKNIHDSVTDDALRELFEPFGTITSSKVMLDEHGASRGFGFVSFLSPDEATKAVTEMHLKLVENKPLYVGLHERREDRKQRLQQKMRAPIRPRIPAGMQPIQFGAPPQMYYGGGGMQPASQMGYAAGVNRPAGGGGYPQPGMMPWSRGQAAVRGYGPAQHPMGMGGYAPISPSSGGLPMSQQAAGAGSPMMAPMGGTGGMNQMPPNSMPRGGSRMNNGQLPPYLVGGAGKAGAAGPGSGMAMQQQKAHGFMMPSQGARGRDMADSSMWPAGGMPTGVAGAGLPSGGMHPDIPVTPDILATAPSAVQKQMLGERLFPLIARLQPALAGKITGMMLDMDNSELVMLLESEAQLKAKVDEALRVLQQAQSVPGPQTSADANTNGLIPMATE